MHSPRVKSLVLTLWLSVLTLLAAAQDPDSAAEKGPAPDPIRAAYRQDAEGYTFYHDAERNQPLKLVEKPIMRWANDDDWTGDVFAWTHDGRPEVVGCILSGPGADKSRNVYHEFHLLAEKPIAPADVQNGRRWQPAEGLKIERLPDAPKPAETAAARLTQMRQIARGFTAFMFAEGTWELRLLTQPLMRYGDEKSDVIDGALFSYVWTKGTDPELILLVECRRDDREPAWYFAPARFSNRGVWLKRADKDVWGVYGHDEPAGKVSTKIYTTAFARTIPRPDAKD
ncbi:MAG TPA: hypothetical protein VMV69_16375 [Pirellulales bacterium]|nr:hypothetical protein [Pirellulales bacterium]